MPPRIRKYTGEHIDVTYDAQRCIHVAECIRRLPTVFDKSKRPWVQTDHAQVAATVLACPLSDLPQSATHGIGHANHLKKWPSTKNPGIFENSGGFPPSKAQCAHLSHP